MMHRSLLILGLIMAVFGLGCGNEDDSSSDVGPSDTDQKQELVPAELGVEFQLKVAETAFLESESIKVRFVTVFQDSRCPSDVVCIRAGEAKVTVKILKNDESLGDLVLISEAGNEKLATATSDGYSVRLVKVDPYPVSTQKIELSDYVITLVVTGT